MSGNWLRTSVIGLSLVLFYPAAASAQGEARSTTATLDTVVVTASRTEEKLKEVTTNVTVINEEAIKKSTASDMSELLRQQGFDVAGYPAGGKKLVLRGMSQSGSMSTNDMNSNVLVLLNGRRLASSSVDTIGLTNVERIEIIRGPAAVQYGPSAMGGVVNIITKRGGEKTEIRAEAGAGSNDMERLKLAASGQSENGRVDFSFGAGQQYRGDYKTGEGWVWDGTRTGNQQGFNGEMGVNLTEGHRLGVNYNYFGIFGTECPVMNPTAADPSVPPRFGGQSAHDVTNSSVAITYDGSSEDKDFNWQGRFSFGSLEDKSASIYEQWYKDAAYYSDYYSEDTVDMKQFTAMLGYDGGGLFALSGGLDNLVYDVSGRTGSTPGYEYGSSGSPEYKDFGAFLSGKLRFLDDSLIFSAGGRFDSYELDQRASGAANKNKSLTNVSPSAGVAWLPVEWLKLRSNYSKGFRMPTPSELWGSYSASGNEDLDPEKSKTWEVGLDVNWEFLNTGLTYFRSKWDDKILTQQIGASEWQYTNLTGATIAGYELALSADLGQAFKQNWTLRPYVNLTYLSTLRNEDYSGSPKSANFAGAPYQSPSNLVLDGRLPNISKMTASYGLDFVEPNIDLTANINATYAGSKWSQDYSRVPPGDWDYSKAVWTEYTPGTIVGLSLEQGIWKFADLGKLKVRAEVNNLFDKYDEAYLTYPGPGRNYYLGLKYEY